MIVAVIVSIGVSLELCSSVSLEKYRRYADYPVDTKPVLVQDTILQDVPHTKEKLSFEIQSNTMKDLYVDALPYALTDTQFNISYIVEECLQKILRRQFETKIDSYGNYCILVTDGNGYEHRVAAREGDVWENIVQTIFEANRSAVIDTRVRQLESRIEMLQSQLNNRY